MSEKKQQWAAWIEELLKAASINASELALRVGVSRMAVSKWRNLSYPNIPTPEHREKLMAIAAEMGLLAPSETLRAARQLPLD